ncbi:MAG: DUF3160 domain-containing protein [Anaerolineales bacterium]
MKRSTKIGFILMLAIALLASACQSAPTLGETTQTAPPSETAVSSPTGPGLPIETELVEPTDIQSSTPGSIPITIRPNPVFATYNESPVNIAPAVVHDPIAPDLSNVHVAFLLSDGLRKRLAENGFVVAPGVEKEFFTLYEKARYDNQPIFVTSDSLLHVYHLLFDKVLRTAEVEYFIPLLRDLNEALLSQVDEQYNVLKGGPWEEAALRTVGFVGVASKLLDPGVNVPDYAADLVNAELALIGQADGMWPSPIFPGLELGEDYTQYIPRGHYTLSDDLKRYFTSMMWYGRMTFRLKTKDPEIGKEETRSALLLVQALKDAVVADRPALDIWQELYSPTAFMVGRSDDLTVLQYLDVLEAVYGPGVGVSDLVDEKKLESFIELAFQLPPPKILGLVIQDTDDIEETTKGLRFMGQRFVPDAYVFRELIYRNVGTQENPRGLPKGLDLFAAMGSERAYELLDGMGETQYERYPEQMQKMRAWLSDLSTADWTETLYNTWLYSFYPLIETPGDGYPAFMGSPAWLDKQLNTVLGSWAELKHDTILYAKQVYAEFGGGPPAPPPEPPKGYVEPVPEFYARLAALTALTREGLGSRGLLDELDQNSLDTLETLARSLQTMAEKELRGEPLSEDEYTMIREYGAQIESLTMAAADTDAEDPNARRFMEEEPQAAVVADVATNPPSFSVLEEAVGRINAIYAVVPIVEADGSTYLQVAKGGIFSYYEFPWPMDDRLTDEKWRSMLDDGNQPPMPEWTASFMVDEAEYEELGRAILEFQKSLTDAYWFQSSDYLSGSGQAAEQVENEIRSLTSEKRYMGHQLLDSQILSFDIQSPTLAVVTTRESWQDTLYAATEYSPESGDEVVAQRGPYTLNGTYTLELVDQESWSAWQVSEAFYAEPPPEFD